MTTTYPSNLAGLRSRVYQRLLTTSSAGHHWTDAFVNSAINLAQQEVQQELLLSFEDWFLEETPDMVPTSNRLTLPEDTIRVTQLDVLVGSPGQYCPVTLLDTTRYHEYQFKTLLPRANGSLTYDDEAWIRFPDHLKAVGSESRTGTYKLTRQRRVADLEDDAQETEIPVQFSELVVWRAAQTLADDAGDPKASVLEKRYHEGLANMRRQAVSMTQTMTRRIRRTRRR